MDDAAIETTHHEVFRRLFDAFGPQHWWPGETPFEVMVGAILVQNTAWTNVERAIAALKASGGFAPGELAARPPEELAARIRPVGYFNVKARRLRAYLDWYLSRFGGEVASMRLVETTALRRELLGVHGVGPETADSILLYALERPAFVVDAYTRRVFVRIGLVEAGLGYDALQRCFTESLPVDVPLYNEYHALIVALGKDICRPKPRCDACPLAAACAYGRSRVDVPG